MAMTRADWKRRYYAPLPGNRRPVHVDHRDDEVAFVGRMIMDLHSFGQFLYHDVLTTYSGPTKGAFDGTPGWFRRAIEQGHIARPNKPFPIGQLNQALAVYNGHTRERFERWAATARTISIGSYLSYLRRHDLVISLVPITDPYTSEALRRLA